MIDSNGNVIEDKSVKDYFDDSYDDGIKNDLVHNMDDATKSFFRTKQHICSIKAYFQAVDASFYYTDFI